MKMRTWMAASCSLLALCSGAAANAQSQEEAATQVDEIIVTGLRRSIEDAIETKRDAVNITDSISAQDIGKLPDQNVVDTLSRVPGVQITRSRGDGANFTIRGISLNTVLINGRSFIGATSGTSDRLDVLSSDIIGSIDVIKSPSADMIEGALGGTVNLMTKRPLDLPDGTFALRAQGQYGDISEELGFRGSALFSGRFADGRVGVLANVAYQNIWSEQQAFVTEGYNRVNDIDGNGNGVNDPGLFRPARLQFTDLKRPVERTTYNAAIQLRPADNFDLNFDATFNQYRARGYPQRYQVLLNSSDVGAVADAENTVVSGRFTGVVVRPLVYQEDDENDVLSLGGQARWTPGAWDITLDLAYGRGEAPFEAGTFTFVVQPRAGLTNDVTYNLANGGDIPDFSVTGNFNQDDPNTFRVASISDNSSTNENDATAVRLDVARDLGWGPISRLVGGYRYEDRSFYTARRVYSATLPSLVAIADSNRDGVITPGELPSVSYRPETGFLDGLSGSFPRSFLGGRVDADAARAQFGYTLPPIAPTTVSDVGQTSSAVYLKAELDGDLFGRPIRGHVGARYISVDRTSAGNLDIPGIGIRPISYDKDYSEILPSATLVMELRDDLLLRVAAASVIATPPLSDLAAGFTYSIVSNTGTGGNPLLDPYKADQADISLEWYFGAGNLLAASVFTKNVKSFTTLFVTEETLTGFTNPNGTGNVFRITRPQNGSDGRIRGFELNYQQAFDFLPEPFDGFGVQANYTYADSETPIVDELSRMTLPLSSLSKNSYSLIGYYEKGPVQARVAYTYRDQYLLAVQPAAVGGSRYIDEQDQLDASFSYAFTPQVRFTIDGQNLLRNPTRQFDGVPRRVSAVSIDDRRFLIGVSATF